MLFKFSDGSENVGVDQLFERSLHPITEASYTLDTLLHVCNTEHNSEWKEDSNYKYSSWEITTSQHYRHHAQHAFNIPSRFFHQNLITNSCCSLTSSERTSPQEQQDPIDMLPYLFSQAVARPHEIDQNSEILFIANNPLCIHHTFAPAPPSQYLLRG